MDITHARTVSHYPDALIEAVITDLSRRNLRDYGNHETRWMAERSTALRAERRTRKTLGIWTIPPKTKTTAHT